MNNISLGRYVPYGSFIHKMDPRTKIVSLILMMVAIFFQYPSWTITYIVSIALSLIIILLLITSHVSFKDIFKSLRVLWFVVLLLVVINILIPPADPGALGTIGNSPIYWVSLLQSGKIILRLMMTIELTMILTATTKPLDLTYALEWFMTPLKLIKFPAHEVAMVISIALRFIPTLLDETSRIMKAQESRGVDFKHGRLSSRFKAIISLIIPLFISAFQRSEELADSMEARGYDPRSKRTRYRILKFHYQDLIGIVFACLILTSAILLKVFNVTIWL